MSGVDVNGFTVKTLEEILQSTTNRATSPDYFGEDFPTTPDSGFGIFNGVFAAAIKDQWDITNNVAAMANLDEAEGKWLDDIGAYRGVTRLGAKSSSGELLVTEQDGLVIPANYPFRYTDTQEVVTSNQAYTLSASACSGAYFNIPSVTTGETYTITVNGDTYSVIASPSDTVETVHLALGAAILAGGGQEYSGIGSATKVIVSNGSADNTLAVSSSATVTLVKISMYIKATAVNTGVLYFFQGRPIKAVGTPAIAEVYIVTEWVAGRDVETDEDFRLRIAKLGVSKGAATKPTIEATVRDVNGVTSASVVENITRDFDSEGRPPKSYEVYVDGGETPAIAEALWASKPCGIETYGDISGQVTDENGDIHVVNFSRFSNKFGWVKVTYEINEEEILPENHEYLIRQAVVDKGNSLERGEDLEATKFYGAIYSKVQGVYVNLVETAITNTATETPAYSTTRKPVDLVTNLLFSINRAVATL